MTATLLVVAACLAAEAFFSGSELAVVSADRVRIRQRAEAGRRAHRLLQRFLASPERLVGTTLLGTQIAIVSSTAALTLALSDRYGLGRAELLTLATLTPVLVLVGEILPKSIAQQHADRLAPVVVYPLYAAAVLLSPLTFLMGGLAARVARRLKLDDAGKLVSREDLALVVKGGSRPASTITDGERRMISRIFGFTELTARDVMVPLSSVTAIEDVAPLEEVVREIEEKRFTRIPVYQERVDRVVGIIHAFTVLQAAPASTARDLMKPPTFAPESQPADQLLVTLQRQRQGMAVVVDEYGGAVGVVTLEDILEEIVGEIEDEHDVEAPSVRKEGDGLWRVRASTPVVEVNRLLGVRLPEGEEYETLAGLVLSEMKHIPRAGETLRLGQVVVTVTAASERAIEELQVRLGRR